MTEINSHVRWMIRRDLDRVVEIEGASFEQPLNESDFIRELRRRNCIGMVAEWDCNVYGHMVYELHQSKIQLVTLAVDPTMRNLGIGKALVRSLTGKLSEKRRTRIMIDVRESNLSAQLFLKAVGFQATRVYRDLFEVEYGFLFEKCFSSPNLVKSDELPA